VPEDVQIDASSPRHRSTTWGIRFAVAFLGSVAAVALIFSGHTFYLGDVPRALLVALNIGTGLVALLFCLWSTALIAERARRTSSPSVSSRSLTHFRILAVVGAIALLPLSDWVLFRVAPVLPPSTVGAVIYYGRTVALILCAFLVALSFLVKPKGAVSAGRTEGAVSQRAGAWRQLGFLLLCIAAVVLFMTSPLSWLLKLSVFAAFLTYSGFSAARKRH